MSLYGAFDKTKHLDELDEPLFTDEGLLTAAQRRQRCIDNLFDSTGLTFPEQTLTFQGIIQAESGEHFAINTVSDDKSVRLNARNYTQATGNSIGFATIPNQTVATTGEVIGGEIKPRAAAGIDAATVTGLVVDSEVKSGAGALSDDLRIFNTYLGATGSGTIGGDVVGWRARAEVNINPTGNIVLLMPENHEGSQGWDGLIKFPAALGAHSMTTNTDKTANAKSGTIKVRGSDGTLYHIQLYAD